MTLSENELTRSIKAPPLHFCGTVLYIQSSPGWFNNMKDIAGTENQGLGSPPATNFENMCLYLYGFSILISES